MNRMALGGCLAAVLVAGAAGSARAAGGYDQGARATRALNLLEDHGDFQYRDFTADGRFFSAEVIKNGGMTQVLIDPATGRVSPIGSFGA